MALVSLRQYAKHRGVSHTAVEKAVKQGRIRLTDGKLDVETADRDWSRNSSPVNAPKPRAQAVTDGPASGPTYAQSRAVRELYLAAIQRLEPTPKVEEPKPEKKAPKAPREGTAKAKVIALISRKGGATLQELMGATEWQAHSVRGFLSALAKKTSIEITSSRREPDKARVL